MYDGYRQLSGLRVDVSVSALTCGIRSASPFLTRSGERRQRQKSRKQMGLVAQRRAWPLIYLPLQYPSTRSYPSVEQERET